MNEKKSNGFAALLLTVAVAAAAIFGVKFAGGSSAPAETTPAPQPGASQPEDSNSGETQAAAGKYAAGTYTATATGMAELTVTVTIGDGDAITEVTVDGPGETPGIGTNAIEQLPGAVVAAQSAEVEAVSGATITSNAILSAVADCLTQAEGAGGGSPEAPAGPEAGGAYKPGSYTAEETGMGKVTVTVTVGEDGAIAGVAVDGPDETPGIGTNAIEQLPEAIVAAQSAAVDAVSGATITSNAIIGAVQSCLDQAAN